MKTMHIAIEWKNSRPSGTVAVGHGENVLEVV